MNETYFRALNSPLPFCCNLFRHQVINNSEARSLPLPAIANGFQGFTFDT